MISKNPHLFFLFQKGDIIDIICKTPMGMWTGLLNNKVGNFKFIYVDLIEEEESASRKIKPHKRSKRAKPKSLQELLERLHLQVSKIISPGFLIFLLHIIN